MYKPLCLLTHIQRRLNEVMQILRLETFSFPVHLHGDHKPVYLWTGAEIVAFFSQLLLCICSLIWLRPEVDHTFQTKEQHCHQRDCGESVTLPGNNLVPQLWFTLAHNNNLCVRSVERGGTDRDWSPTGLPLTTSEKRLNIRKQSLCAFANHHYF